MRRGCSASTTEKSPPCRDVASDKRWLWPWLLRIIELKVLVQKLCPKSLRLVSESGTLGVDFCDNCGIFNLLDRVSIGHRHDIAGDKGGSCENPRRYQPVAVRHLVDGHLHQTQ